MADAIDPTVQTELEAAAFRRLLAHFRERTDVQNKDVMDLAGFCRNCLAKWYRAAAVERGVDDAQVRTGFLTGVLPGLRRERSVALERAVESEEPS